MTELVPLEQMGRAWRSCAVPGRHAREILVDNIPWIQERGGLFPESLSAVTIRRRAPHVPGRSVDDPLRAHKCEPKLLVELDVFSTVRFKIASSSLLFEMLHVPIHQGRANAPTLCGGDNADGSKMHMGLLWIQSAPRRKPIDQTGQGRA